MLRYLILFNTIDIAVASRKAFEVVPSCKLLEVAAYNCESQRVLDATELSNVEGIYLICSNVSYRYVTCHFLILPASEF